MHSGVACVSRDLVMGTLNKYEWVQIGGAIKPYAVEGLEGAKDIAGEAASDTVDAVGGEVTSRVLGDDGSNEQQEPSGQ